MLMNQKGREGETDAGRGRGEEGNSAAQHRTGPQRRGREGKGEWGRLHNVTQGRGYLNIIETNRVIGGKGERLRGGRGLEGCWEGQGNKGGRSATQHHTAHQPSADDNRVQDGNRGKGKRGWREGEGEREGRGRGRGRGEGGRHTRRGMLGGGGIGSSISYSALALCDQQKQKRVKEGKAERIGGGGRGRNRLLSCSAASSRLQHTHPRNMLTERNLQNSTGVSINH